MCGFVHENQAGCVQLQRAVNSVNLRLAPTVSATVIFIIWMFCLQFESFRGATFELNTAYRIH